jgi:predicted nuclease with TOPRIM domain
MAEQIKFTKEELDKIKKIRNSYESLTKTLGGLEVESIALEVKKDGIKGEVLNLQTEKLELAETLRKKYGDGILNPETGIFTPNK